MQLPIRIVVLCCLAVMLNGCGGQDYTYDDGRDRKEGPGLFSGQDGVYTIYRRDRAAPVDPSAVQGTESETGRQEARPTAPKPGS